MTDIQMVAVPLISFVLGGLVGWLMVSTRHERVLVNARGVLAYAIRALSDDLASVSHIRRALSEVYDDIGGQQPGMLSVTEGKKDA